MRRRATRASSDDDRQLTAYVDGEPDALFASSSRDGFAVTSWANGGRGYMLIGNIPIERLTALARSLKEKTG